MTTAILRAAATAAFLNPLRAASRTAHALSGENPVPTLGDTPEPDPVGLEHAPRLSLDVATNVDHLANKAARIAWVIMTRGEAYRAHRPATEETA